MLTDDELSTELRTAFRDGTTDLTYDGRRRPRRTAVVAVPVAAVTVAIAAIAIGATAGSEDRVPGPAVATGSSSAAPASPALVTDTVELAGYSFTYQRAEGETAPIYATEVTELPDGLRKVSAPEGVQAWVGKDPRGDNALYVKAPTRNGGNLFALHSPVWTQDELVDLFHHGTPRTVPMIKD